MNGEMKMKLESMLCSDAKKGKRLNPSACQTCTSSCEYGIAWLKTLGLEPPKREGVDLVDSYNEFQMPRSFVGLFRYINRKGLYVREN